MAVNNISNSTINTIKSKSAYALPDNPSQCGMSPNEIKGAMWKPLLDTDLSIVTEINRIINEVNAELDTDDNEFGFINLGELTEFQLGTMTDYTNAFCSINGEPFILQIKVYNLMITQYLCGINDIRFRTATAVMLPDTEWTYASPLTGTQGEAPTNGTNIVTALGGKVNIADVVDNLTSTSATAPLSANQGKELNNAITEINNELDFINLGELTELQLGTMTDYANAFCSINGEPFILHIKVYNLMITQYLCGINDVRYRTATAVMLPDTEWTYAPRLSTLKNTVDEIEGQAHTHSNKAILDATTQAYTVADKTLVDNAVQNRNDIVNLVGEATNLLNGLMSANDKSNLDTLVTSLTTDDGDNVVNTIKEILAVFEQCPEGTNIATALAGKVNIADVVNNLTSTSTTAPLSANQGKVLYEAILSILSSTHPVGTIYISTNSTSPATLFGGSWTRIQNRFLVGVGTSYPTAGATGGYNDAVVVAHTHGIHAYAYAPMSGTIGGFTMDTAGGVFDDAVVSAGESGVGKNIPPYYAVYMWKRIS